MLACAALGISCGGRVDPLDPRAADRSATLPDDTDAPVGGHLALELALRGFVARERGDPVEAERLLRAALEQDPDDAALLTEHARSLTDLERDDEALGQLRRALESDPSAEAAWLLLARIEHGAGRIDAAFDVARRAIRAEPRGVEAALWLADQLVERGEEEAARELLAGVLARRPDEARAHLALADTLLAAGDADSALRHLRRYAELAVVPGPALADRIPTANRTKGPGGAAEVLEIAVMAGGAEPGIRLDLVRLLVADGRLERARRHLLALPPARPGDTAARLERAELLLAAGDPWEARGLLLEEPARTLADTATRRLLADVETALGRLESAAALLRGR